MRRRTRADGGRRGIARSVVADGAFRILVASEIGARTGDGPEAFADVSSLAADRSGRLYVVDSGANEIRVFDSGNGYVARFGRQGSGPGELLWSGVRVSLSTRNLLGSSIRHG